MFNDDGLGEAMALAHARDAALAADKRSRAAGKRQKSLEARVSELTERVAKLEAELTLMRSKQS
jgi:uncharacterized protein YceH (UPF0502 family)